MDIEANKDNIYAYLDILRESGSTNMFGATPYLVEEFNLTKCEANVILMQWMRDYESEATG